MSIIRNYLGSMSAYYTPQRTRGLYQPGSSALFKLSRSKIDLFLDCPRCFYLDRRLGVGRPPGFPFALNSAVDHLLKQEFDAHRAKGEAHPLMKAYGLDAIPMAHEQLDNWRNNFVGVQYLHQRTNLLIFGAIDDLWGGPITQDENDQQLSILLDEGHPSHSLVRGRAAVEYIVVDYKSTAKRGQITALDQDWQDGYKRQMEIYQWLLRRNCYRVSATGYFVYCNGQADRRAFDAKLEFEITLIPYTGDDHWIEPTLDKIHHCLNSDQIPDPGPDCDFCAYLSAANKVTN